MHFAGQHIHKNIFKLNADGSNPLIIQSTCIPSFMKHHEATHL